MSLLIESLCLRDGIIKNIHYHHDRMNKSRKELLHIDAPLSIEQAITIPPQALHGIWKIRIHYTYEIEKVEFEPYQRKTIRTLTIVTADDIDYSYKYADRTILATLFELRKDADDIIIIKNGLVTDSSSANVVFYDGDTWVTPSTPLLPGTKRAKLLQTGVIHKTRITVYDIPQFMCISLINAFLDIGDIQLPIRAIQW
ncbi:MAG: aminotransferase class IV [Spirochaetota bacterium]